MLGTKTGQAVDFLYSGNEHGGIVGDMFDNKKRKRDSVEEYTITLHDIFRKYDVPQVIDYMSLDVEGAEEFVLRSFPFDRYRFNVLTIERPTDVVTSMLTEHGYTLLKTIKAHEDTLWIHSSIMEDVAIQTDAALAINSEQYKYRDNTGKERIVPEELDGEQQQSKPIVQ